MSCKPRLLVVDDEPVVCESCRRIFESQGFAVDTSTDSREGLRKAHHSDYAVIILDIKMPDLDGVQFVRLLRRSKRDVPVVVITGYAYTLSPIELARLGIAVVVTKPFTPDDIEAAVESLNLERR